MINESILSKIKGFALVHKARRFAKFKHRNHKRKYTGDPYFNHLHEVADLVHRVAKAPPHVRAAAYLHDTVEDTDTTNNEIKHHFGPPVAQLVHEVTDQHPYHFKKVGDKWYDPHTGQQANRKIRKAYDNEHLAKTSYWGATIKLADMISNTRSIAKHDPDFAKVYLKEKSEVLPRLKHGHPALYEMAKRNI